MGLIRFRCSDELESRLAAAAAKADVKSPDLARAIFERALPKAGPLKHAEEDEAGDGGRQHEQRSERLYARLTPSEYSAVDARASMMGMTPYTWTARLIRAHLTKAPELTFDETRALREATRELSYIGRNLNQVAHALNMTPNAREKATFELIEEINVKVDAMRDTIKAVLDQNLNRWGV